MGCSNARLLVQAPSASEPGAGTNNPLSPSSTVATSPANVATDTNNTTTRMHLTGVDLVVERNGSYTLLLTPKTHKQLMPYVLRKKRFRILVDKPRSDPTLTSNEPNLNEKIMENNKELKLNSKKDKKSKKNQMESTIESIEQVATDELNKAKARFIGGRSIDRGNYEDEDEYIQSDDEGMIEEIVTTVEQDKDLECKIKKKIETKRTIAQNPQTHNTITKVVKTEVTEITRTITINDHHDLERAKRELGIDDVNRLLPSLHWNDQSRLTQFKEKHYEPTNEIITSKDFPSDSTIKQSHLTEKPILAESTTVGRGPVIETISSSSPISEQKLVEIKKKKKKSKLCSCTRSTADDEHDKQKVIITPTEEQKKISPVSTPIIKSTIDTQIQGQQLISSDIKQLIIDKKFLLIEYIHSKIFSPTKLFTSNEQDTKARKISSRILDLLRYDRCSSWIQMFEQLTDEYANYLPANLFIRPMINTYENLFTYKQSNLLNTFSTIHNEHDIKNIQENSDYINIVQTSINERDNQLNIGIIAKQSVDNIEDKLQRLQQNIQEEQVEKVININEQPIKEINMTNNIQQTLPSYNEEQLIKMLADISQHKPITLAEAIAYQYIDIEDPKLALSNDTIQRIKNLFRPLSDENVSNLIRVKRSGEYLTDVNLAEINPFEKLNLIEPYIYQLQQTFEPTLDFNEKQFRLLTETILNNKDQYDQLQFDIARTSLPIYDMKESSTNDFSQSDSGYSMTTATHESLASKIKIEFEPINHDIPIPPKRDDLYEDEKIDLDKATQEQLDQYELNHDLIQIIKSDYNESDKTIGQAILSRELRLNSSDPNDISYLNSLGIHKEQARILTNFFFPKHTRIIAYSPEPGRFVEAQTTYNPDYPGYKTDTTIIQIQEKQLSSDHLAMQRNIHDDRTSPISSQRITETEIIIPSSSSSPPPSQEIISTEIPKEKPPPTPVYIKKRKSSGSGSLLSCFKSKKPKAGTEQQGQSTVQPTIIVSQTNIQEQTIKPIEEKPLIDYSILPDGKRIYIDLFRHRPGLDMSYKPNDFENRFILPVPRAAWEYERPITPDPELIPIQSEIIQHKTITHIESQLPPIIEHKTHIHLQPRPATIEPVDVQPEQTPIVIPSRKSEEIKITKKPILHLHGAAVNLPKLKLVEPGPLPTLPIIKSEESTVTKTTTTTTNLHGASVDLPKIEFVKPEPLPFIKSEESTITEKTTTTNLHGASVDLPKIEFIKSEPLPIRKSEESTVTKITTTNLHGAPVDLPEIEFIKPKPLPTLAIIKEKHKKPKESITTEKTPKVKKLTAGLCASCFSVKAAEKKKKEIVSETIQAPIEQKKIIEEEKKEDLSPIIELSSSTVPLPTIDQPILPKVNIDIFKERHFQTSTENFPKSQEHLDITNEKVIPPPEEPHYQLPTNEPVPPPPPPILITKDSSIFSKVNIDTFKERTFQKSSENLPKPEEHLDITIEESHYQLPSSEPVPPPFIPIENEYLLTDRHTYDTPRTIELEQTTPSIEIKTEEKIIINEIMVPPTTDIQKSSGDFHPTEHIEEKPKIEEISPIKTEITPKIDIKKTKIKSSLILPIKKKKPKEPKLKTNKKSNLLSTFFRHNERISKIPALNLPSIERDLSPNNQLHDSYHDKDPLHIPSIDLPKLNIPLPTYNQPEVDMTSGHIKQSSEFSIPTVDLPLIPNLSLPENDKQLINLNFNLMKIPNIQLPDLETTLNKQENIKLPHIQFKIKTEQTPIIPTIETGLALASPVDDMLDIQIDHKNFPIETDYAIKTESIITTKTETIIKTELISIQEKYTNIDTNFIQPTEQLPLNIDKQTNSNLTFQLPSPEPVLTLPKDFKTSPPSFDDDVPTAPSKIVSAIKSTEKQPIEIKSEIKKKSSTLTLCSCFSNKSIISKEKTHIITIPKAILPEIDMPLHSSNISSTLKTKGPLSAPSNDLPSIDLTPTSIEIIHLPTSHIQDKKQQSLNETEAIVPSIEIKKEKEIKTRLPTPPPIIEKQSVEEIQVKSDVSTSVIEKQSVEEIKDKSDIEKQSVEETKHVPIESKKSLSFEIKAPIMNIPQLDLSGPPKIDAYLSLSKKEESTSISEQIQSRSDSGLEAIISSHIHPSSTFDTHTTIEDIQQHPSISSGLGSEILDNITTKGYTLPDIYLPEPILVPKIDLNLIKHDYTHKITINDEICTKLIIRQNDLKNYLENEISKSIDDFHLKKDQKSLDKILTHGINLIKDKKVITYPELKQKLIIEHKNDAFIVDPIVRSLYYTLEKQGLDNIDKPEFPLAIHDMLHLPAKQTYDTVTHLNKEAAPLTTTQMTKETFSDISTSNQVEKESSNQTTKSINAARSCLTCGRSKSKTKLSSSPTTGLLDERHRLQLNTHRNELGNILRDHIQSTQPSIRKFTEHSKEIEKIIRKSLILISQPKILSYEQLRNDLKTEYKQIFYLIDPIIDIIRDTFNSCDITQMNEKINLDILDSNISQTAYLYNNQKHILTIDEYNSLKSNQLSWLEQYLINNELKTKKLTRKQTKIFKKILHRTLNILSLNIISIWDELIFQLQREYPKAHDLCNHSVELIKQSQKDGLFFLQQAPIRRSSSLITEHARQNLKINRINIILSLKNFLINYNQSFYDNNQLDNYLNKIFNYLEEQKQEQLKTYNDLKEQLKKDFQKYNQDKLIEQIVDIIEQAHATNQFDDIDKPEVQILMKDRLDGKPLVIKEMYVSLPSINGDRLLNNTTSSHHIARGLSWREANERARILFYRGKHPAIHYDEQAAAFDVRMLLETASGGTQEIPVTDSDVHELLNSCGVQWDGVNIISLVDHSEDVVRAAEQAALKVIREKGIVDIQIPSSTRNVDELITTSAATSSS